MAKLLSKRAERETEGFTPFRETTRLRLAGTTVPRGVERIASLT